MLDDLLAQQLELLKKKRQETARQRLIAHGVAYLRLQLVFEDDLDARERLSIERDLKRHLEEELTGEESTDEVEAFVVEVLDEMRGDTEEQGDEEDWDDQDEEEDEGGEDEEQDEEVDGRCRLNRVSPGFEFLR